MESIRKIVRLAWLSGAAALVVGCTPVQKAKETIQHASTKVAESTQMASPPATQMLTVWQNELKALPDSTRDGAMVYGLVGQVFLLAANDQPAMANGDLTVAVHDETERPNGAAPKKPEVWHITSDVLPRLRSRDERLGVCYLAFLPWPPDWTDVTKVRISTRYDVKDKPHLSLTAQERRMVLEKQSLAMVQSSREIRSAPNPNAVLAQLRQGAPSAQSSAIPAPAAPPVFATNAPPSTPQMPQMPPALIPPPMPPATPSVLPTHHQMPATPSVPEFKPIIVGQPGQ